MTNHLPDIQEKYERIMNSNMSEDEKNERLSTLMTLMERAYNIPALQNEQWERENRSVLAMYRKLSMSRSI